VEHQIQSLFIADIKTRLTTFLLSFVLFQAKSERGERKFALFKHTQTSILLFNPSIVLATLPPCNILKERKKEKKRELKRKIQIIRTALLFLFALHHLANSAVFLPQVLLFFHSTGRTFLSFLVCPSVRPQEAAIATATSRENSGCLSTIFPSCI